MFFSLLETLIYTEESSRIASWAGLKAAKKSKGLLS